MMRALYLKPHTRLAVPLVAASLLLSLLIAASLLAPALSRAQAATFGASSFTVSSSSTQAGAHSDLTVGFHVRTDESGEPIGQVRDVHVNLPTGIVGNPLTTPKCTTQEFEVLACKPAAQIGIIGLGFHLGGEEPLPSYLEQLIPGIPESQSEPIVPVGLYNLTPIGGHLATFAGSFLFAKIVVEVDLANDGSDGLRVKVEDLPTLLPIVTTVLRIWGVPAAESHNLERSRTEALGPKPIYSEYNEFNEREIIGIEPTLAGVPPTPFMTSPTNCSAGTLQSELFLDSWQNPGEYVPTTPVSMPAATGCEQLHIEPQITVQPDTKQMDTPAGYDIDLHYPLHEAPFDLGTPALSKVAFQLPQGTSLSPAVATGLLGCSDGEFAAGGCPEASKVGTVVIHTPLLTQPLTGSVYIGSSTPAAMYRIFINAAAQNLSFSLKGIATPDPLTGQLTISFEEMPQLPFDDLNLRLFGGPGAAFANSATCGPAASNAQIVSYAGQVSNPTTAFAVNLGAGGGACPSSLSFAPNLSAGTTSPLAASYSPLDVTVSRPDGQQTLSTISVQLPQGLLAMLSTVPTCPEPQAALGTCSQASETGSATIGAGAGSHPLWLPGRVYLTGPHRGAPFGLSIVVPAIAGPFNLGTIVIQAQVLVDPHDLHLTIVSDPLPQIRDGIPLRIKAVNLSINRPGFIFNPTDCAPRNILGTFGSNSGTSASTSTPFQVAGCVGLPFNPGLALATRAIASSSGKGAPLDLNLTSRHGQANLRSIVVELPKQLQSRLTTLQTACLAATYQADRHKCPAASVMGEAKISTPILSTPLAGAIYLVSYGRGGSPTLSMVLEGQGIAVDLTGTISIVKKRITRSAFNSLPDAPITSFSLNLFQGPHSLLGPNGNLCAKKLVMPTTITAQNGIQSKRTAKIAVSGCHATSKKKKK